MRRLAPVAFLSALAALACTGAGRAPEAPSTVPATPASPSTPAPAPAAPAAPASNGASPTGPLPASSVPGVPGWLGATVLPPTAPPTTEGLVLNGASPIVVFSDAWAGVPAGTPFVRVDRQGAAPVSFVAVQTPRYGCDGGQELPVAGFTGASADPLVWIVPPGVDVAPVPLTVADTSDRRTWTAAGQTLRLQRTGPDRVDLLAPDGQTVLHHTDLATDRMEGDADSHLDLRTDFLLPQLRGAWTVAGTLVVAGEFASYEGDHYVVYTLGAGAKETEVAYLYRCAF